MGAGGFVGQMHQTNNQNREWLKKVTRRSFELPDYNRDERRGPTKVDLTELTDKEKLYWRRVVAQQKVRDAAKKIVILVTSVVVTGILFFLFYAELMDDLIEFIN
jgi:hypothetical protein